MIESPSLAPFPFDSDQPQQPLTHFLTLIIFRQSRERRLALAQSLRPPFEASGGRLGKPAALGSKGKADGKTEIVTSWSRDAAKSLSR